MCMGHIRSFVSMPAFVLSSHTVCTEHAGTGQAWGVHGNWQAAVRTGPARPVLACLRRGQGRGARWAAGVNKQAPGPLSFPAVPQF